eukprot:Blabericola_migrator_1__6016@NODE_302_length_10143_cov_126_252779_g247_i1_p5_GENE_NODE_302_length_10143_cov_126_252779_g247_i1NODE_302_length_10143_cov_126_252779_g247_i1_p5_ORF_typecomplete_len222_score40_19DUF3552/PF12072_8/0_0012ATG16/PF08614_11/0_0046PHM7_cyt/PF14703_6/0_012MRPL47/PF06984_13/0_012MRPL47/PF06984_13/1e03AAA_15/PF13175_6/0_013DUF1732/PF08340_11/0_041MitMem_reg/PF13012_6/0_039ERM/PF00769_19/0_043APG6_N/PF17675_1/0_049AAA_13/PF13166_6/0_15AAA_23/PF13476_6/0_18TTKRSYEDQ/PF10212_9/
MGLETPRLLWEILLETGRDSVSRAFNCLCFEIQPGLENPRQIFKTQKPLEEEFQTLPFYAHTTTTMSWCCMSRRSTAPTQIVEESAMEVRIKDALDNTEVWLMRTRERKMLAQKQRMANQAKREKLESSRTELITEKTKADEALTRIYSELSKIDAYLQKLSEAEAELDRIEEELKQEEQEIRNKEESVKSHLTSIAIITGDGSSQASTTFSVEARSPQTA